MNNPKTTPDKPETPARVGSSEFVRCELKYFRTYRLKSEGGGCATHIEGIGDSYTLCGLDVAGDYDVHEKPPEELKGKHRVTCEHCQQIISIVRAHLKAPNIVLGDKAGE